MSQPRQTLAEREREAREEAARKRALSLRLGGAGVLLLFLGGIGTVLVSDLVVAFLGSMVLGIVLLVGAFLLIRGALAGFQELTKTL